jgi:endonuclease-3
MLKRRGASGAGENVRRDLIVGLLQREFPRLESFLSNESHFQLLIAVILSARCTDDRVNEITKVLFAVAPDARAMAQLSTDQLEAIIHSAGFFRQKARAITATAEILLQKWDGEVPLDFENLEALPGVGHKTASVVIGHCTAQQTFPVDTHVQRLARRWEISAQKTVDGVERDLKNFFPEPMWFPTHQRMIAYGRKYCTARGCDGTTCEICRTLHNLNSK